MHYAEKRICALSMRREYLAIMFFPFLKEICKTHNFSLNFNLNSFHFIFRSTFVRASMLSRNKIEDMKNAKASTNAHISIPYLSALTLMQKVQKKMNFNKNLDGNEQEKFLCIRYKNFHENLNVHPIEYFDFIMNII